MPWCCDRQIFCESCFKTSHKRIQKKACYHDAVTDTYMTLVCIFHQSWQKSLAPSPCQCHMLSLFYYVNSHANYQKSSVPWCCVWQMAHYFTTEKSDSLQHPVECRSHRERGCKNSMLDLEQSENTISKEWMQDHIQRNRAWNNHKTQSPKNEHKTVSTEERCRQYCFEYISASTPKSQFYLNFWRPTSISCERLQWTPQSQFYLSFWRPTSISRVRVAIDTSKNRNFTSVFDVQRPFRAKRLRFVALRRHRPRLKRER